MSHGIQVFDRTGGESLYRYTPRNLVQVVRVNLDSRPSGRIYPWGEYEGTLTWYAAPSPVYTAWQRLYEYITHPDGSLEWWELRNYRPEQLVGSATFGREVVFSAVVTR